MLSFIYSEKITREAIILNIVYMLTSLTGVMQIPFTLASHQYFPVGSQNLREKFDSE
jgi:hypothetical protein